MGIDKIPGVTGNPCKDEPDTSNRLKVVLKKEKDNTFSTIDEKNNDEGKKGITALVRLAIDKTKSGYGSSTGGDASKGWSGSLQTTESGKKSFILTGSASDGEYLLGTNGLKNNSAQSEGTVLTAKKESNQGENKSSLKIGGTKGKQENNSPQVQVKKEELKNGMVTVSFMKINSSQPLTR